MRTISSLRMRIDGGYMKLGTSTNLFARKRLGKTALPYIEQTTMCHDAGFKVLDLCFCDSVRPSKNDDLAADDWEKRIDALADHAAKLGVEFTQSHAPFFGNFFIHGKQPDAEYIEMFNEMMRRAVIASGKLGIKWMTVHPHNDNVNTEFELNIIKKTNMDFYAPWLELAKKHNIGLSIENMAEFDRAKIRRYYCSDTDELIDIVDSFNDEAFGVTWDFGHAKMMINDQCRQLRKLGKRLKATHVQDNMGEIDSHLIPFVGGSIKWEEVMPCLKEIGYTGDFMFECHSFMNEIPDALRPSAAKLAYDFGTYCMGLYEKA